MSSLTLLPPSTLSNVRLGISASTSPDIQRLGLLEDHFRLALGELGRTVLVLGGELQYCGHLEPTGYTTFLLNELKRYGRRNRPLSILLAWSVHRRLALSTLQRWDNDLGLCGSLTCLDVQGGHIDVALNRQEEPPGLPVDQIAASLTAMRIVAAHEAHGRILIGGQRSGYQGVMPGVMEEAAIALEMRHPLFLAGGFGGVTLDLVSVVAPDAAAWLPSTMACDKPDPGYEAAFNHISQLVAGRGWAALANGLDAIENARLAATYRPSEIAALVSLGLGRLAQSGSFARHAMP